jgi:hypothetical protein
MASEWSSEDLAVWDSLVQAGFIHPDDPYSLLSLVNGAARFERARILKNLHTLPEEDQAALHNIIVWISIGAPDRDPR